MSRDFIYTTIVRKQNLFFLLCAGSSFFVSSFHANAQIISSFAGGHAGYSGDGGPATNAYLNRPNSVAADDSGNVFILDYANNVVRKVSPSGIINNFAGNNTFSSSGDGGPATAAGIGYTNGITADSSGNVYISNGYIRKIDKTNTIATVIGCCGRTTGGDGGPASAAGLNQPVGLFADRKGNIYIADDRNHNIRKVNSAGIISTIAGTGTAGYSGDGGPATNAELNGPTSVTADELGNVYIADYGNFLVRKVNTAGIISTFAGNISFSHGLDDRPATAVGLTNPYDVKVDAWGNVYISEDVFSDIRVVTPSGIIHTYAGVYPPGYSGDGGPAVAAQLDYPSGIDIDLCGNMYIANASEDAVRKISGIAEGTTNLCIGDTATFQTIEPGGTWSSSLSGIATVSATGFVTAIATGTSTISYTSGVISAITTITVNPAPASCTLTGTPYICLMSSEVLENSATGGTWSQIDARIGLNDSMITGLYSGWDTVVYTLSTACRTAKTEFPVFVLDAAQCDSVENVKTTTTLSPELRIYPNPGKGLFTLLLSSATSEPVYVTITNVVGQKIKELTTHANQQNYINLDEGRGVYFISAVSANNVFVSKVIVE